MTQSGQWKSIACRNGALIINWLFGVFASVAESAVSRLGGVRSMAVGFVMVLVGLVLGFGIPDEKGNPVVFLGMLLVFGVLVVPGLFIIVGGFFGWQRESGNRRNKTIVLVTVLAVVLSSFGMFLKDRYDRGVLFVDQTPPQPRWVPGEQVAIGVIPFKVLTYDPVDLELAETGFDLVIAALEKQGLSVPERDPSVIRPIYENQHIAAAAATLGATHILSIKFSDSGDQSQVVVLLHTHDGAYNSYALSKNYDRSTLDLPAIYEEIGRDVAAALRCRSRISSTINPADCAYR